MLKTFFYKSVLFTMPIILLLILFVATDPFLILYQYNDYTATYRPVLNRDFISGETYINKRGKYHYNSFMFGSSRLLAYPVKTWQKYLDKDAIPFKFDASSETIFGIHSKIKYIDTQKDTIKNALLVVCQNTTFVAIKDSEGLIFMKHPKIAKTSSIKFYTEFMKALLNPKLFTYLGTSVFTNKYSYLFPDKYDVKYDTVHNDLVMQLWEKELKDNPKKYYESRKELFYQRNPLPNYNRPEINAQQIMMLKEIKQIFDKHQTKYKIVISPLYNQVYFNKTDVKFLQAVFGANHVYDYSGINNYTNKEENYYEDSHYKPHIGEAIMSEIYR
jgi:hypothetical protein